MQSIMSIVQDELDLLKKAIQERMLEEGITVTGKTAQSIESYVTADNHVIEAILKGRSAFSTVERGRSPGGVPTDIVGIIKQWIIDKGLSVTQIQYKRSPSERWKPKYTVEERSLNMAAGAISHTIKTKGTKLYRDGGRTDIYTPLIDEFLERVESKIYKYYKIEILNRI